MTETLFQLIEGSAALASFFVCLLWLWQVWLFKQDRERERAERAELRQEKKTLERAAAESATGFCPISGAGSTTIRRTARDDASPNSL